MAEYMYVEPRLLGGLKNERASYMDDGGHPHLMDGSRGRRIAAENNRPLREYSEDNKTYNALEANRAAALRLVHERLASSSSNSSSSNNTLSASRACTRDGASGRRVCSSSVWIMERRKTALNVAVVLCVMLVLVQILRLR